MKIDPRIKLAIIVTLTTLAVLAPDIVYLGIILATSILLALILGVDVFASIKRLRHLLTLILFISLIESLIVREGTPLLYIKDFVILSLRGLIKGAAFALRMSTIIFASSISSTEKGRGMTDALIKLKIPYVIAFMVSVTIRFVPMLREEFVARLNAVKMRGISIKKLKFKSKIKLYAYLLTPTLEGCMIKSRELSRAMESKAFGVYSKRTMLRTLKFKVIDYAALLLIGAYIAGFTYFSITVGGIL